MKRKWWDFFNRYLTRKIDAEIKCCLTFFLILFFYCIYRFIGGRADASILHMLEMTVIAYVLSWVQLLMQAGFDQTDRLEIRHWAVILGGSALYALLAHWLGWFDKAVTIAVWFGGYMVAVYLCTFLLYAIKRSIDARLLNDDLKRFQQRNASQKEA